MSSCLNQNKVHTFRHILLCGCDPTLRHRRHISVIPQYPACVPSLASPGRKSGSVVKWFLVEFVVCYISIEMESIVACNVLRQVHRFFQSKFSRKWGSSASSDKFQYLFTLLRSSSSCVRLLRRGLWNQNILEFTMMMIMMIIAIMWLWRGSGG